MDHELTRSTEHGVTSAELKTFGHMRLGIISVDARVKER